jgi:hypothetical protein
MTIQDRRNIWLKEEKLAIILTDCKGQPILFDKAGLETLTGRLDVEIEVQGYSADTPPKYSLINFVQINLSRLMTTKMSRERVHAERLFSSSCAILRYR